MAVGLPLKTTYANGDVYSASDVNDTNGTVNLIGQTGNNYAGKNLVYNANFNIWQRGTSFTSTNGTGFFGPDRFNIYSATTGRTFSRQNTSPNGSLYYIRMQRNSGNINTSEISIFYTLETIQSRPLAGKTLTLSFYARAGANFSAASNTMFSPAVYGTGTDQNQIAGFTGSASIANQGNVLTTSWQRFTMTGTVNAAATQVGFQLVYTPTGTAGANDYMDIADVQWEIGSTATVFATATGSLATELAACQRYYEKSYRQSVVPGTSGSDTNDSVVPISSVANNESYQTYRFAVTKRTDATITTYSYNGVTNRSSNSSGTDYGANSADPWRASQSMFIVRNSSGSSMTIDAARFIYLNWVASAEL